MPSLALSAHDGEYSNNFPHCTAQTKSCLWRQDKIMSQTHPPRQRVTRFHFWYASCSNLQHNHDRKTWFSALLDDAPNAISCCQAQGYNVAFQHGVFHARYIYVQPTQTHWQPPVLRRNPSTWQISPIFRLNIMCKLC